MEKYMKGDGCCQCYCKCEYVCEKKNEPHCADQRYCRTPCDDRFWMVRPVCKVCPPCHCGHRERKGCGICRCLRKIFR